MILNYLKCQRPWLFISAADSDASDRTRRTRCKRENNLWYPGQSRLDFRHLSSPVFDASRKELFRKGERGFILKTADANRAYNRQKGQLRVIFSLNGRKLLSPLQARRHLVCQSVQHMAICSQHKVNLSAL